MTLLGTVLEDGAELVLVAGLLAVGVLLLANLADQLEEAGLVVELDLGRGLEEGTAEALGQLGALGVLDLAVLLQIALVADQHDRDLVGVLGTVDLVEQDGDLVEGGAAGDVVDQQEALAVAHPLVLHGAELLLAGGVQDVQDGGLVIDDDLLPVAVLDGGVVLVQEVVRDQANGQRGLTDATGAQNDKLWRGWQGRTAFDRTKMG